MIGPPDPRNRAAVHAVRIGMHVHRLWPVLLALVLGCDAGQPPATSRESEHVTEARYATQVARLELQLAKARLAIVTRDLDQLDRDVSEAVQMIADAVTIRTAKQPCRA